jgi:PAS domain S-box-containing protein
MLPVQAEGGIGGHMRDKDKTKGQLIEELAELRQRVTELEASETERQRAEEALRASEKRYRELFENANDAVYTHDLAGNFTSFNRTAERIGGYTRDEALKMNIAEIVAPEYLELARQMIARKVAEGVSTTYELEVVTKDGRRVPVEVSTRLVYEGGKPVGVQGIARDITERKRAEEELRSSEERLKILFESAPDAYYLSDLKGNFVDGNEAAEELVGYKREELIGKNFLTGTKLLSPGQIPKAAALLARNLLGQPTGPDEFILNRKDGNQVTLEIRTFPVKITGQSLALGIARDITERKRAEEELEKHRHHLEELVAERTAELTRANEQLRREIAERKRVEETLRESEERYRRLFNGVPIGLCLSTPDGQNLDANPAMVQMLGYPDRESFLAVNAANNYVNPQDREQWKAILERDGVVRDFEVQLRRRDGTIIWALQNSRAVRDNEGQVVCYEGAIEDITERKQAEEALRESEEQFSQFMDNLRAVVFIKDEDSRTLYVNRHMKDLFGPDDSWIGQTALELFPKDEAERMIANDRKALREGPIITEESVEGIDGVVRHYETHKFPISREGKSPLLGGIAVDITERKQAEEALRESEARFRSLAANSPDTIYIFDLTTFKPVYLNREELLGYTSAELEATGSILNVVHPEDLDAVREHWEQVLKRGVTPPIEYRLQAKDGRWEWLRSRITVLARRPDGTPAQILVTLTIITERKQAEEALRASEERFRQFFENEPEYCYIVSPEGVILDANAAALEVLGYSKGEIVGKPLETIYAPESLPEMKQLLAQWRETGSIRNEELVIVTKTGDKRTVLLSAGTVRDREGKVLYSVSVQRDITERKQAEAEIKTLRGLLPICASCKKIRDDRGYWHQVEVYVRDHSEADFSHSICPDCAKKLYPGLYEDE